MTFLSQAPACPRLPFQFYLFLYVLFSTVMLQTSSSTSGPVMSSLPSYSEISPLLQDVVSSVASQPDNCFIFKFSYHFFCSMLWHLHSIMFYKDLCTCSFPADLKFPENKIISSNFVFPTAATKTLAPTRHQCALS